MHITILAYGSRGDVQPYIALGLGLKQAGHTVRVAAPEMFRSFVTDHNLEFAPLAGDPRILIQDAVERGGGRTSLLRIGPAILKYAAPLALQVIKDARQACQGTEAIIHTFLTAVAGHEIALQMAVPDFAALLFAVFSPTGAFPNATFPDLPLGSRYNRITHRLFTQVYKSGGQLAYSWITRGKHDIYPPLTEWPFAASSRRITPILYGFSPTIIPKPPEWNERTHVSGFWLLQPESSGPSELTAFLEAGPPPVCISFGSVIDSDAQWLTGLALEALARTGQRGVLVKGWGGLSVDEVSSDIFVLESVPFDWLFPQVSAAVIHGGIGTTAAAMRAGIPVAIIPFTADQGFWGKQVHRLGLGPEPLPRHKLTADRLAQAIKDTQDDASIRQNAYQIGQKLQAEDGVHNAVQIIECYLQDEYKAKS